MEYKLKIFGEVFNIDSNISILENLEKLKLSPIHSCRNGHCGICEVKIIGKVEYFKNCLISPTKGYIYTCCTKAKSDIEIIWKYNSK